MKLLYRGAGLFAIFALTSLGDVSYNAVQGMEWKTSLSWIEPGASSSAKVVTQIQIKGNRLAMTSGNVRRVYDLDAGTLTTIDMQTSTYSVESLGEAYARFRKTFKHYQPGKNVKVTAKPTGNHNEFALIADGKKTSGEALCLLATQAPPEELNRFRKKWQETTKLPFPDNLLAMTRTSDVYAGMIKAEAQLPGYVIGFVTPMRPFLRPPDSTDWLQTYDASYNQLPVIFAAHQEPNSLPSPLSRGKLPAERPAVEVDQMLLHDFRNAPVPKTDFDVPAGFQMRASILGI